MTWKLRDGVGQLQRGNWSVVAQLNTPQGIPRFELECTHGAAPSKLLVGEIRPNDQHDERTAPSLALGDAYVRQGDLIASYPEQKPWRFGYQVDIRTMSVPNDAILVLEIWLSVQTSLLDSHPQLEVLLKGDEFSQQRDSCWTFASEKLGVLVHPLDALDCRLRGASQGLELTAFGRFMEKGVIRRMRFRIVANSQNQGRHFWEEQQHKFSESPLPLTT